MRYKILIADDEPLARERLRQFLADEFDYELVGEAANGREVMDLIRTIQPELILLDIAMPEINGMQVAQRLTGHLLPLVVFTTAHADHAVDAYAANVVDYLLKPFDRARFRAALAKARELLDWRTRRNPPAEQPRRQRLLVKSRGRYLVVAAEEISWLEAAANYVVLHTPGGNHVVRCTMAEMTDQLGDEIFFRTGRSHAVNLKQVIEVQMDDSGQHSVVLQGGQHLRLQRNFRELQQRLETIDPTWPKMA